MDISPKSISGTLVCPYDTQETLGWTSSLYSILLQITAGQGEWVPCVWKDKAWPRVSYLLGKWRLTWESAHTVPTNRARFQPGWCSVVSRVGGGGGFSRKSALLGQGQRRPGLGCRQKQLTWPHTLGLLTNLGGSVLRGTGGGQGRALIPNSSPLPPPLRDSCQLPRQEREAWSSII